jgi:hypothetical protein
MVDEYLQVTALELNLQHLIPMLWQFLATEVEKYDYGNILPHGDLHRTFLFFDFCCWGQKPIATASESEVSKVTPKL